MLLIAFLLAVIVPLVTAQNAGSFTSPPVGINQNDYDFDPVWYLGETQLVSWTTGFNNYTITLWQQTLPGGSATPGPAVISIAPGSTGVSEFPWTVTDFAFDLRVSPVFFFWLTPGPTPGLVPKDHALSSTSRYFNISAKAPPSSTTSTSLLSAPLSSTTSTSSSLLSAPLSSTTSTSSSLLSASSSSTSSTSLSLLSAGASSTTTTTPPERTTSNPPASSLPSGLSTGDKIGITFGAIIIAVIIIGLAMFFTLQSRKKEKKEDVLPQYGQQYTLGELQKAGEYAELQEGRPVRWTAELGQKGWRPPVELG